MKNISLFSGYIYLTLAIITGIASNGFLKTTEGLKIVVKYYLDEKFKKSEKLHELINDIFKITKTFV